MKKNITELTDEICELIDSVCDAQTVRIKANEYAEEGIFVKERKGRVDYFSLSQENFDSLPGARDGLLDAINFFQATEPFGVIGSTILDGLDEGNELFKLKHYYIVHTLKDSVRGCGQFLGLFRLLAQDFVDTPPDSHCSIQ